jgi:hypothetical protein
VPDAIDHLLEAGREESRPRASTEMVADVAEANTPCRDYGLSLDQALAVGFLLPVTPGTRPWRCRP